MYTILSLLLFHYSVGQILNRPEGLRCPKNWLKFERFCYLKVVGRKDWHGAKQGCQNLGANLTSIMSRRENQFLIDNQYFGWIGLMRDDASSPFRWVDGRTLLYTNWKTGEPRSATCTDNQVYDGFWSVYNCNAPDDYICKKSAEELTYSDNLRNAEKELLKGYDKEKLPRKKTTNPVKVRISSAIQHIVVDENQQTIELRGFMSQKWIDLNLGWNTTENKVKQLFIGAWRLWNPNIIAWNSAGGKRSYWSELQRWDTKIVECRSTPCKKKDGATVAGFPKFSIKSTCIFDYSDYPNDVQTCPLRMIAAENPMSEIELKTHNGPVYQLLSWQFVNQTKEKVHLSNWIIRSAIENTTYINLQGETDDASTIKQNKLKFTYSVYNIWLVLERHSPYYGTLLLCPSIVCSFLILASFWSLNIGLSIQVLVGSLVIQAVFTHDLMARLPASVGSVPRIVKFYGCNMLMSIFAIAILIILKEMSTRQTEMRSEFKRIIEFWNQYIAIQKRKVDETPNENIQANSHQESEPEPHLKNIDLNEPESKPEPKVEKVSEWKIFAQILKFLLFAFFCLFYFILYIIYLF